MLRCEFSSSRAAAGRSSGRRASVSLVVAAAVHVLLALATSVAAAESEDVVNFQLLADATLTLTLAGRLAQTQGRVFVHARARGRGGGRVTSTCCKRDWPVSSRPPARRSRARAEDGINELVAVADSPVIVTPDGALKTQRVVPVPAKQDAEEGAGWIRARGIQYAQHPVGLLRWQPPVPRGAWYGTLDATQFGANCVQAPLLSQLQGIGRGHMSEGCLFLNVWAPATGGGGRGIGARPASNPSAAVGLAVLVWVHGGSFTMGGSSTFSGDGIFLHRRDVVLVTINYRLGAFGWLAGPHVQANTTDGSKGNFGLQDVQEALRWVRRNIRAFGGDPSRVTVAGESAGASIVETLLAAPTANGLFERAIMQSGARQSPSAAPPAHTHMPYTAASRCLGPVAASVSLQLARSERAFVCMLAHARVCLAWSSSRCTEHI